MTTKKREGAGWTAKGTIYVLKFSEPIGNPSHPVQHYLGWTLNLDERLEAHRAGAGAKVTAAAVEAGRQLILVCAFEGRPADEAYFKEFYRDHKKVIAKHQAGTLRYAPDDFLPKRQRGQRGSHE